MAVNKFQRIQTQDATLEGIQANIQAITNDLRTLPELNANYIPLDVVASTDILVEHGLGKACQYYEVVKKNAAVDVWDSPTANTAPKRHLILRASGTATIILKVY